MPDRKWKVGKPSFEQGFRILAISNKRKSEVYLSWSMYNFPDLTCTTFRYNELY